jgi:uncharacterized coiled-coil protein SlyX
MTDDERHAVGIVEAIILQKETALRMAQARIAELEAVVSRQRAEIDRLPRELADVRTALTRLIEAVATERQAQDRYIATSGADDTWNVAADLYEDACATTIIRENEARSIIAKARG